MTPNKCNRNFEKVKLIADIRTWARASVNEEDLKEGNREENLEKRQS